MAWWWLRFTECKLTHFALELQYWFTEVRSTTDNKLSKWLPSPLLRILTSCVGTYTTFALARCTCSLWYFIGKYWLYYNTDFTYSSRHSEAGRERVCTHCSRLESSSRSCLGSLPPSLGNTGLVYTFAIIFTHTQDMKSIFALKNYDYFIIINSKFYCYNCVIKLSINKTPFAQVINIYSKQNRCFMYI